MKSMYLLCAFACVLLIAKCESVGQSIPSDRESLKNSEGAGMAKYADENGYPGPKHILDMEDQLSLSEDQRKNISAIFEVMKENARSKGEAIIEREESLDQLFVKGIANEDAVKRLAKQIGTLRGELRAVHMVAHIQAKEILTHAQTAKYNSLRHNMPHQKSHK